MRCPATRIDVLPLESEELADAEAGLERHDDEGEPLGRRGPDEAARFLEREVLVLGHVLLLHIEPAHFRCPIERSPLYGEIEEFP